MKTTEESSNDSQLESRDFTIRVNQKKYKVTKLKESQRDRVLDNIVDISKQKE